MVKDEGGGRVERVLVFWSWLYIYSRSYKGKVVSIEIKGKKGK